MGGVVACRIIVSAPVPFPFLWTLDFRLLDLDLGLGIGTWNWDLGLGLGLGLDNFLSFLPKVFTKIISIISEPTNRIKNILFRSVISG